VSDRARLRVVEAREGVERLRDDFDEWCSVTTNAGHLGQYATQLTTLGNVLRPILTEVRRQLVDGTTGLSVGATYDLARSTDIRVAFCHRLWRWFGDRFDQRVDPRLRDTLLAADEVVWSSWEQAHRSAGRPTGPAPLPAIDGSWVATATARVAPPADVRTPNDDELLRERASALPIPVIGLPAVVVRRPWWLVVAVHETGHHVHYEFAEDLVSTVAEALCQAAKAAGAEGEEAQEWANWSRELFADGFSAALAGPSVSWAIEELEIRADKDLLEPRDTYPPPVTRLSALQYMLKQVGVPPEETIITIPDADTGASAAHTRVRGFEDRISPVVDALFSIDVGGTTLSTLGANATARRQNAALWRDELLKDEPLSPVRTLEAARECVSGAVWAWQRSPDADDAVVRLRERVLAVLPECREDGVRAAPPVPQVDDAVGDLLDVVLHLEDLA
jgi:hypothetical protein